MRKITKFQKDYNCLPYSFFIREHQYERRTKCYETEVIDMKRRGNYVYIRPNINTTTNTYFLPREGGWTTYSKAAFKATVPVFVSAFEEDYYKYIDIKVTVSMNFANSQKTKIYPVTKVFYLSAYVGDGETAENPDEENEQLFCGYDYEKLDSLPIKNQKVVDLFKSLNEATTDKAITLVSLTSAQLTALKKEVVGSSLSAPYFIIDLVNVQLLQRRAFFEIGADDPWKEYESTKFGTGNSTLFLRRAFEFDIVNNNPNIDGKYFYPFLVKNEIIREDINVKTKEVSFLFDKYCGYYTTDKSVLPVGRARFTSNDTIYRKPKKSFGVISLTEGVQWPIVISDDTNPDDAISKAVLQSFSMSYNEEGLPYLIIDRGDKENITVISSTATEDLIGNSEDKGCQEEFQFEEYFFDSKITRNNKVIKIVVMGKLVNDFDEECLRLGVYAEVVKNTTIYERYQKVTKS